MLPSYLLSIETPTPIVLGVGVMFAPVTGFVHLCFLVGDSVGTFCVEEYLHCVRRLLALQAVPSAPPTSPRGNFFGSFASWDFFFFFFPPLRRAGEAGGVSGCT